jgi:hypothetical protein
MKIGEIKWFRSILLGVIAAVEFTIIFSYWPAIWQFLQSNSELRLLSTIIPILLSAPFAYFIWTWRDHDKQRIINTDESRLAFDIEKNKQDTEKREHELALLRFEAKKREVEKKEENNNEKEIELKKTINELVFELDSLKKSGTIVPKINSNLEKFMLSETHNKISEYKASEAIEVLAANSRKNEESEKHKKSEEHNKLLEAIEALKAIEVLKSDSRKNDDSEEDKKVLEAIEFLKKEWSRPAGQAR